MCSCVFTSSLCVCLSLSLSSHSLCLICLSLSVCLCPPPTPFLFPFFFFPFYYFFYYYFKTQPSVVLDFVHLVDIVNFLVHVVLFFGNISTFADDNIIIYVIYDNTVVMKTCCFVHPILVERLYLLFSAVK